MAKTFTKLVSLVAYDATLTERTDDFYLRAKTMPDTVSLRDIAAEVATRLNRNEDGWKAAVWNSSPSLLW